MRDSFWMSLFEIAFIILYQEIGENISLMMAKEPGIREWQYRLNKLDRSS
jgi:hypothetical protein